MKKIVAIYAFLACNCCFSQQLWIPKFVYKGDTTTAIRRYVKKTNDKMLFLSECYGKAREAQGYDTPCDAGFIFVKFRIGTEGQIRGLAVSQGADTSMARILHQTIRQSEGNWEPARRGRAVVESSYMIIPFYYDYRVGFPCKENKPRLGNGNYMSFLMEGLGAEGQIVFGDGTTLRKTDIAKAIVTNVWSTVSSE